MTVEQFARKKGFDGIRELVPWRGYACYEAVYGSPDEMDVPTIGYPQIILAKGARIRMATLDETIKYMEETPAPEEEGE